MYLYTHIYTNETYILNIYSQTYIRFAYILQQFLSSTWLYEPIN